MNNSSDSALRRKALVRRYRATVYPLLLVAVLASVWLNNRVALVAALVVGCATLFACRAYVIKRYGPADWAAKMREKRG